MQKCNEKKKVNRKYFAKSERWRWRTEEENEEAGK